MRRLPVVAAAAVGLVLALFGGAAACGCVDQAAAQNTDAIKAAGPPPGQPDEPLRIFQFGKGTIRLQREGEPPPPPPPPPPPWSPPPGATPQVVKNAVTLPWGEVLPGTYAVSPMTLKLSINIVDEQGKLLRDLTWPPDGTALPERTPVSLKVLEGKAVVYMKPITSITGERYWVRNGRVDAEVGLSYYVTNPGAGITIPLTQATEVSPLPNRIVLVPVMKQGEKEITGQGIEITIRPYTPAASQ